MKVEGGSSCPNPAQVQERLSKLLLKESEGKGHIARVERTADVLLLELRDLNGAVLARRELRDSSSCSDLASVAAVVIAAWETELGERVLEFPPAPPLLPPPPAAPAPRFEGGLGLLASYAGAFAVGGLGYFSVSPGGWRLGGELVLFGVAQRSVQVGPGRALWYRLNAGVGPTFRLVDAWLRLDLQAHLLASMLGISGAGFSENTPVSLGFDLGALAGARVSIPWGPVRPWLGISLAVWPAEQEVHVGRVGDPLAGSIASEKLPRFELLLLLGVSLGSR